MLTLRFGHTESFFTVDCITEIPFLESFYSLIVFIIIPNLFKNELTCSFSWQFLSSTEWWIKDKTTQPEENLCLAFPSDLDWHETFCFDLVREAKLEPITQPLSYKNGNYVISSKCRNKVKMTLNNVSIAVKINNTLFLWTFSDTLENSIKIGPIGPLAVEGSEISAKSPRWQLKTTFVGPIGPLAVKDNVNRPKSARWQYKG